MLTLYLVCDLDREDHVLFNDLGMAREDSIIVAMTRRGLFHLLDQGIPFTTPMEYISADRSQELAEMTAERLEAAISFGEERRGGLAFNPVRPLAYRLLHFFSYGMFVVDLLDAVSDHSVNGVGSVRVLGVNRSVDVQFGISDLLDLIVGVWCSERDGTFVRNSSARTERSRIVFEDGIDSKSTIVVWLTRARQLARLARNQLRGLGVLLALQLNRGLRHKRVVFTESSWYDLEAVTNAGHRPSGVRWIDLRALGTVFDAFNGVAKTWKSIAGLYQRELKGWWDEQMAAPEFAGLFSHRGISLAPAVRQYCEKLVTDDLDRGLMPFLQAQWIFSHTADAAALVSLGRGAVAHGAWIAEAALSAGIPCVGVAHGGAVGLVDMPRHRLHYRDLSVVIHYGPDCYLPKNVTPKNVGLGSPRLGKWLRGEGMDAVPSHTPCTIVWCWHGAREIGVDGWIASWDRLVMPRLRILHLLADVNYRVVIRPFPGGVDDVTTDYAQSKFPGLMFERDRSFLEIIAAADVLVLEYPSTPLIEAICTIKPILFFAASDIFSYRPGALELLRRRCVVFDTAEEYVEGVRRFLKDPKPVLEGANVRDTAFQQAYALPISEAEFCEGLARVVLGRVG